MKAVHFMQNRANLFSPYGWSYWLMMVCNVVSPQIFWFRKLRRNLLVTFFMSIIVNIGMWFERFVIIVTSVYRDYLPSSWSTYYSSHYLGDRILPGYIRIVLYLFLPVR